MALDEQDLKATTRDSTSRGDDSLEGMKTLGVFSSVQRFLIGLYVLATVVGFSYAYAYYDQFDIDFLDFATVLDFIFASLANIGTLPTVILFVVLIFIALTLLLVLSVSLVGLSVRGFFKSSSSLVVWKLFLLLANVADAMVVSILSLWEAVLFVVSTIIAPLRKASAAVSLILPRRVPGKGGGSRKGNHGSGPRTFRTAYASIAHRYAVSFTRPESGRTKNWVASARKRTLDHPKNLIELWRQSWSWFGDKARDICLRIPQSRSWNLSLLVVFTLIATATSARTGIVNARCVLKNGADCDGFSYFRQWLPFFSGVEKSNDEPLITRFIIPSSNLAFMRSATECGNDEGQGSDFPRDYMHVSLRQGLGAGQTRGLPSCLVYIGAVEHAHFLARIHQQAPPESDIAAASRGVTSGAALGGKTPSGTTNGEVPSGKTNGATPGVEAPGAQTPVGATNLGTPSAPTNGETPSVTTNSATPGVEAPGEKTCVAATKPGTPTGKTAATQLPSGRPSSGDGPQRCEAGEDDEAARRVADLSKREFMATVGPFRPSSDALDTDGRECDRDGLVDFSSLKDKIKARLSRGWEVTDVMLIGHVDSRPINTRSFRSNLALAQARVEETYRVLKGEEWAKGVDIVRLPAGPRTPGRPYDGCDRNVEVHMRFSRSSRTGP